MNSRRILGIFAHYLALLFLGPHCMLSAAPVKSFFIIFGFYVALVVDTR